MKHSFDGTLHPAEELARIYLTVQCIGYYYTCTGLRDSLDISSPVFCPERFQFACSATEETGGECYCCSYVVGKATITWWSCIQQFAILSLEANPTPVASSSGLTDQQQPTSYSNIQAIALFSVWPCLPCCRFNNFSMQAYIVCSFYNRFG